MADIPTLLAKKIGVEESLQVQVLSFAKSYLARKQGSAVGTRNYYHTSVLGILASRIATFAHYREALQSECRSLWEKQQSRIELVGR